MKAGPSQEPNMRADQTLDAALLTVVIALFVAAAFGLHELPGGAAEWAPIEWKGVHDCAKGLILPILALRFGLALNGQAVDVTLRNRIWVAMAFCWVGDISLTFPGDTAFLMGLVSFLLGHIMFIATFRHLVVSGWETKRGWVQAVVTGLLTVAAVSVVTGLWGPAGELAPAIAMYAAVITLMALISWYMAPGPGVWMLRLGTTAFVASDMILAFGKFGETPIAHGHFWVIGTYIVAQWALAIGFTQVALSRATSRL
jgi:uncharacterized membrane protein YhhN